MQSFNRKTDQDRVTGAAGHGCWDILLACASHYPIHGMVDLMRMTTLAQNLHCRGLLRRLHLRED